MIIDARTFAYLELATVTTDVCIVGAGPAGISLALEFNRQGFRVCLLDSGGLEWDPKVYYLNEGENVGLPYVGPRDSRFRGFGGSLIGWEAHTDSQDRNRFRTLDDIDFEQREWVPHSGWPFDKSELLTFYEKAQQICGLGPLSYELRDWEDSERTPSLPLCSDRIRTTIFQSGVATRFTEVHREEIIRSENITLYHHATVVELESELKNRISRLRVTTLEGNVFWVAAKVFILAAGGIENARLLLASNKTQKRGIGNDHDLVGRFFMEHPHLVTGIFIPSDPSLLTRLPIHSWHLVNDVPVQRKLALHEDVLRRERLLNYALKLEPTTVEALTEDLSYLARRALRAGVEGTQLFKLSVMSEQAPNPNSRVTLSDQLDVLGVRFDDPICRQAQLDWQLTPLDIRSLVRAQQIIQEEFHLAQLGRVFTKLHTENLEEHIFGGNHHMGTTRMHPDPSKGVVDVNCRVHGVTNLYIAGSSVFPTVGFSNPTLTIVALAVRLAQHIKQHLHETSVSSMCSGRM